MKCLIQSQDHFGDCLILDPVGGLLTPAGSADVDRYPVRGSFSMVDNERVLIYRWNGTLWIRFGDDAPMNLGKYQVGWRVKDDVVQFTMQHGNEVVVTRSYRLSKDAAQIADDPTPFVEAEDFDFLLFVRNVSLDLERAARIYLD